MLTWIRRITHFVYMKSRSREEAAGFVQRPVPGGGRVLGICAVVSVGLLGGAGVGCGRQQGLREHPEGFGLCRWNNADTIYRDGRNSGNVFVFLKTFKLFSGNRGEAPDGSDAAV